MMRTQHLIGGIVALALAGCAGDPIKLHALEGPIAAANPGLILGARNEGGGNTGRFSYVLPGGATCSGQWQRVSNLLKQRDALPVRDHGMVQSHGGIRAAGEGNALANRARKAAIEGRGTCSSGATFEFASYADGHSGRGALRDSNGNIFKITMR
jgi:hypothetical protein